MQRICSWLSNEIYRFFDGVARFEIMSRTSGRLSRTLTRAQHWIRHIFSHRPPTINWNKPSYAQESGRFLEIVKSRIHPQTVQICSRKGAKLYYDKMIALWHSNPPIYALNNLFKCLLCCASKYCAAFQVSLMSHN